MRTVSFHVLLFYGPMYILSIFHHLSIPVSSTLSIVPIYLPFPEVHTPFAYIWDVLRAYLVQYTSPLYLFSPRLMQLNVCHTLYSWHELLTHSPTYRIFPPDSSQFAGCSLLQSMTITVYFSLSPNHASTCFTTITNSLSASSWLYCFESWLFVYFFL